MRYALSAGADLWHDPDGEPYIDVRGEHGERRTLRVRSRSCRTWLSGLLYTAEQKAIGGNAASDAIDVLAAMAVHDGRERPVHVRVAEHDGAIYLDLADDSWRAVCVTANGWDIVSEPPMRFRRPRGLRSLPEPVRQGGGWADLRTILHLGEGRDWILLVAWLVGTLHPSGPYPILGLAGEHGTGKTTVGRMLRSIVDPSEAPLRSPPRNDQALVIAARNGHILGLDNLSWLPNWLSDALCRIATGGGYSARELYSDGDEVIFADRRPVILTSIEDVAARGDLADRMIPVTLPLIPEGARRTEAEVRSELDRIRPAVLGDLLDAVATGLRRRGTVKLERLPRMADYAQWVVSCEPSLPWREGTFLTAYAAAREDAVETGIDADPVASALLALVREENEWSGTSAELLAVLDRRRGDARPPKRWPETPQAMGGRLRRAAPLLRAAGVEVARGEGRTRYTIYLSLHKNRGATDAHEAHQAHEASDDAAWEREERRERDGRDGDRGAQGEPDAHGSTHANRPTTTTDVRGREHCEQTLHRGAARREKGNASAASLDLWAAHPGELDSDEPEPDGIAI